tara:strand:+ start:297 stop:479 length:183 start_codon:yes stop_codon:yes gene_type:complete
MSNKTNDVLLESNRENALELTRHGMLSELGVSLPEQKTAFLSNDDLADAVAQKWFEEQTE